MRFGTAGKIGLGLFVSAICLWLAIRQAPIAELGDTLGRVNYWWLLPVTLGNVASHWARGCRWRILLGNRGTRMEYFWAQCIGSLLTNVFPLRAGEAGRAVVVSRRIGLPLVQVGASLIPERALDLAAVMTLLATLLLVMDVPWAVTAGGLALGAAMTLAWIGVIVLLLFGQRLTVLVDLLAQRLPTRFALLVRDSWSHLLVAIEPLRDLRVVAQVIGWTIFNWVVGIGTFWAAIEAVVPGGRLLEASFGVTALSLGVALPSSPGFIGVFQFIGQQALVTPFPNRYTPATALMIAILSHGVYYVSTSALGLLGLARLGLSLRAARGSGAEPSTEPAG